MKIIQFLKRKSHSKILAETREAQLVSSSIGIHRYDTEKPMQLYISLYDPFGKSFALQIEDKKEAERIINNLNEYKHYLPD